MVRENICPTDRSGNGKELNKNHFGTRTTRVLNLAGEKMICLIGAPYARSHVKNYGIDFKDLNITPQSVNDSLCTWKQK